MARPKKFDYDSDDFYDEILALSMQGLTDAEIGIARQLSGLDKPNMIVYGGGDRIREICLQNSVLYVEQFMANRASKKKGGDNG